VNARARRRQWATAPSRDGPVAHQCTAGDGQWRVEAVRGEESAAAAMADVFETYSVLCMRRDKREKNKPSLHLFFNLLVN
jgi:hypothetical protein